MMLKCLTNAVMLGLMLLQSVHAFMKTNTRAAGSFMAATFDQQQLQATDDLTWMSLKRFAISWGTVGMGAAIGGLIAGAVVGGVMFAGRKTEDSKEAAEEDGDEKGTPLIVTAEEAPTDYAQLIKNLGKKVVDDVGPKFEKGGAVRNVLEERLDSFQDKAKNFLLNEMNGAAGAVMREMEAEESMLLLDWNNAVESTMPPASILIAGVLSPTVINLMASHHLVQMVTVGLPLVILCVFAIYVDFAAPCSIPTIFGWLYTQTVIATLLFVGHGILFAKLAAGRKSLQAKQDEVHENLEGTEDGGFANVKEKFIGNTIILQEALMIENGIRHSVWNTVVGVATVCWLITTIWNLVLIAGWTFVPGIVAFHPKAAAVAKTDFCGAWATVLVLRISMLLSVLYLFLNIATVIQWLCDVAIKSSAFSDAVLKWARQMDKNGSGMPLVEMLVKAFLLRGGDETIISRLAVVQYHKKSLKNKQAKLADKLTSLTQKLAGITKEEDQLNKKVTAEGGGDLATQVHKLNAQSVDYDNWKKQGSSAIEDAEMKAIEIGAASTDALDKLYEKINEIMEEVKNSETVQAAAAKAQEAKEYAEQKAQEAYDKLNDPEFQQQMRDLAAQASAQCEALGNQAKDLANDAIAAASDPEFQKQLQDAANAAMDQAKAVAEQAAAAANDPELQKKLKEAMELAQAKAMEAAATVTDPELQKKMQENAMQALEQTRAAAESAAAALVDPEMQKKLQESAMAAVEEAKALAAQAAAAATDPKIREAALAKLKEAQKAAEMAAAAAQDPEMRKKFEEQAQKAMEQAKTIAAQTAEAATEQAEKAKAIATEQGAKASEAASAAAETVSAAAKDVAKKAKGKKK